MPSKQYEKQKRGGKGKLAVTTYDDDFIESFFTANTHDTLMFVTDQDSFIGLKFIKFLKAQERLKEKQW